MLNLDEKLDIVIDDSKSELKINFSAETSRAIYDVCDFSGKILKTGPLTKQEIFIDLSDLASDRYILLILDGDRVFSRQFNID